MQQLKIFCFFFFGFIFASCSTISTTKNDADTRDSTWAVREDNWLGLQANYRKLQNDGVFFFAQGSEPFWQIDLGEKDSKIIMDSMLKTFSSFEIVENFNGKSIQIKSDEAGFLLKLTKSDCTHDSLTFPYEAILIMDDSISAIGCGSFLYLPQLHDIWILKSGGALSANDLKDLNAYVEFNLQTQKIYLNLSCGEATASIIHLGNKLKISEFEWRAECSNGKNAARIVDLLESKTHELFFNDNKLRLVHNSDSLSFIKGD